MFTYDEPKIYKQIGLLSQKGRTALAFCAVLRQYSGWLSYPCPKDMAAEVEEYKTCLTKFILADGMVYGDSKRLSDYIAEVNQKEGDGTQWLFADNFLTGLYYIFKYLESSAVENVVFALRSAYDMSDQVAIIKGNLDFQGSSLHSAVVQRELAFQDMDMTNLLVEDSVKTYRRMIERSLAI